MTKSKCPAGNLYEFMDIGTRVKRKAVKCLFKGNIYDLETIQIYCLGHYLHCPVYRSNVQDKENEGEPQRKIGKG